MFERFGDVASKVLALAAAEARRSKQSKIEVEHILLGLLADDTSQTAKTLNWCGVTLKDARAEIDKLMGTGTSDPPAELALSPGSTRVLERAGDSAAKRNSQIRSEDLLSSLLLETKTPAIAALQALGVDVETLRMRGHKLINPGSSAAVRFQTGNEHDWFMADISYKEGDLIAIDVSNRAPEGMFLKHGLAILISNNRVSDSVNGVIVLLVEKGLPISDNPFALVIQKDTPTGQSLQLSADLSVDCTALEFVPSDKILHKVASIPQEMLKEIRRRVWLAIGPIAE